MTIEYRMISKVEKMDIHKLPKQQIDIKKNDLDSSKHNADRSGLSFTQTGRTECKVGSHWSNHGIWAWVQTHSLPTWLTSHNQDSSVHLRHVHCKYNLSPANIWYSFVPVYTSGSKSQTQATSDLFILARHGGIGYNHYIYIYIYIYNNGKL